MMNSAKTTRIRFFQTSADVRETALAAKAQFETEHPGRWVIYLPTIVAASPGDENGNRWVDIELKWVG